MPQGISREPYLTIPSPANRQYQDINRRDDVLDWYGVQGAIKLPERSARVRDVPSRAFFELQRWRQRHHATLVSMQLEGNDEESVKSLIEAGIMEPALRSSDWLQTAGPPITRFARQR